MFEEAASAMRWFSLPLGDGLMASEPSNRIVEAFQTAYESAGSPPEMAVFTQYDAEGGLHCEVTAFFSPAAGALAKAFEARPCPKPVRYGLGLLAGDERAWEVLFPGGQSLKFGDTEAGTTGRQVVPASPLGDSHLLRSNE